MKIGQIAFIFLAYGILKFMIVNSLGTSIEGYSNQGFTPPSFPTLKVCFYDTANKTGCDTTFFNSNCSALDFTCSSVAAATANIAIGIYIGFLFLTKLIIYLALLIYFIASLLFSTIPDAPWYINLMILTPLILGMSLAIFRMLRSGNTSD